MMKKISVTIILSIIVLISSMFVVSNVSSLTANSAETSVIVHYKGYEDPYVYYWNTLPTNIEVKWPGSKMTLENNGWYTYKFEGKTKVNLIFNDGGNEGENQTKDLTRNSGEWWYKDGSWTPYNPEEVSYERTDMRDETVYFVITTRFFDGYLENNVHCWDENAKTEESDPGWRGDFQGLIDKLDYIKALGFSAIWLTPVVENASGLDYHGYHALDFAKVDPRYESEGATYQDLIDAAHAKGIKIIQDIVLNHTSNFGEKYFSHMFDKTGSDLSTCEGCMVVSDDSPLEKDYFSLKPGVQYDTRLAYMKDTMDPIVPGTWNDPFNYYHHYGFYNWDEYDVQLGQIAGDCVDLNTENPIVAKYLVDTYKKYIAMGVDGFRVDTAKHISRLTFNNYFNKEFKAAGGENFYMVGEVCTKSSEIWYRGNTPPLSAPFYTWAEDPNESYDWKYYEEGQTEALYNQFASSPVLYKFSDYTGDKRYEEYQADRQSLETKLPHYTNLQSTEKHYNDHLDISAQPISKNAFLDGNDYHKPDYSMASGFNVIDFPMHWNFLSAQKAFNVAVGGYDENATDAQNSENAGDQVYNDATWNLTYVDSHDYAPDGNSFLVRYDQGTDAWAENLSLMFTFRGIPCLYYGSEIEFQRGVRIDDGPNITLANSGRAYFGDNIEGTVVTSDFSKVESATGTVAETLKYPLVKHIQRLNEIRRALPALRKGQYSVQNVKGSMAYKRRYTDLDNNIDNYVLVTVSEEADFTDILNGTYIDAITGKKVVVTDNTLHIDAPGKGNLRVYVLQNKYTKTGKIGTDGDYLN